MWLDDLMHNTNVPLMCTNVPMFGACRWVSDCNTTRTI